MISYASASHWKALNVFCKVVSVQRITTMALMKMGSLLFYGFSIYSSFLSNILWKLNNLIKGTQDKNCATFHNFIMAYIVSAICFVRRVAVF